MSVFVPPKNKPERKSSKIEQIHYMGSTYDVGTLSPKNGDTVLQDDEMKIYNDGLWYSYNIDAPSATTGTIDLDYETIFKEMSKRFAVKPVVEHKCHNCGAPLKMEATNHIFKCPYCHSVYAVGLGQVNS